MGGAAALSQQQIDDFVAACHFDLPRVRRTLGENPDLVDSPASWDETPLQAAAQMGNRPIMELLLENGARLDGHSAAALGDAALVQQFIETDREVAIDAGVHGLPALYFAAVGGSLDVAELLIAAGAPVDAPPGGNGPLHGAALAGHLEMVRWLLAHGADRNAAGYEGKTALDLARQGKHLRVAALLS